MQISRKDISADTTRFVDVGIKNNIDDEPFLVCDTFQMKESISIPSSIDQRREYSNRRSSKIVITLEKWN